MEIEGVRRIIEILKPIGKIEGYVHDKDAKTTKLIKQMWGIREYIDPNHSNKSFNKKFAKYNGGKSKYCLKGSLSGLQKHLSKFKTILVKSDYSILERENLWLNAVEHFSNNHSLCIHKPYENSV